MTLTRRGALALAGAALAAPGLATPGLAEPAGVTLGWLGALTGPTSSTGIGLGRGVNLGVATANADDAAGRKITLLTRDTQSDPTKAVNAAVEMAQRFHVNAVWGPGNSGETLACTPVLARAGIPQIHPCFVDQLIDPAKYPNAFRIAPDAEQIGRATNRYALDVLKAKRIALFGDTTGYGTASVNQYGPMLKQMGGDVVYQEVVEPTQADLTANVLRMRDAGAQVIMPWSVNPGLLARLLNARGQANWNVPVAGQPTLGSGEVKALLAKPEYWENVFGTGFRSCSYDSKGRLPARTQGFLDKYASQLKLNDTLLWWVVCGYDAAHLFAAAVKANGPEAKGIIAYWNGLHDYPGVFADYSFSPTDHNGYPDGEVVMARANSFRDGAFQLAPGFE